MICTAGPSRDSATGEIGPSEDGPMAEVESARGRCCSVVPASPAITAGGGIWGSVATALASVVADGFVAIVVGTAG